MMMGCIEMDKQTKKMIDWYIPSPPDPDLDFGEYYYRQSTQKGEQVIKVLVMAILPGQPHGPAEYVIYQIRSDGLRWVDVGWGDRFRGAYMSQLYDNKQDCRDQTHAWCEDWERLRKIQKEEGLL